jgi:hypothetical protein
MNADDIELKVTGGVFKDAKGNSLHFTGGTISADEKMLSYNSNKGGNPVAPNGTDTVTYKISAGTVAATFTIGGANAGDAVAGQKLSVVNDVITPNGTGYHIDLDLQNLSGSILGGSVQVYDNTGFFTHFNADQFDVLRNAVQLYSDSFTSLSNGATLTHISADIPSIDDYVVVTGMVDAGDGAGSLPFSIGVSSVPEPTGLVLLGSGLLGVLGYARLRARITTA